MVIDSLKNNLEGVIPVRKHLLQYICIGVTSLLLATSACALAIEGMSDALEKDVLAQKQALAEPETVYYVDVAWGDMQFTYNAGTVIRDWDPTTHSYKESVATAENAWSCVSGANKVTVTNRSNTSILATVTAQIKDEYSGITATVNGGNISLADASEGATLTESGTASEGSATVTLSGALTNTNANKTEIGSVKISISDTQ